MKKILLTCFICTLLLIFTACTSSKNTLSNNVTDDIYDDVKADDTATDEAVTDDTATDEAITDDTATDEAVTDDTATDEAATDDTATDEAATDEAANPLETLIDTIYTTSGLEFPSLIKTPLTKENQAYMLGLDTFDFIEGFASEPMISAQAHSVVLFTIDETLDIEAIKESIRANVDGYKWICVGLDPENIIVDSKDNMIILIMDTNADALHDAFLATVN